MTCEKRLKGPDFLLGPEKTEWRHDTSLQKSSNI